MHMHLNFTILNLPYIYPSRYFSLDSKSESDVGKKDNLDLDYQVLFCHLFVDLLPAFEPEKLDPDIPNFDLIVGR